MRILPRSLLRAPMDLSEILATRTAGLTGDLADMLRVNLAVAQGATEVDDLNRAITEPDSEELPPDLPPPPIIKGRPGPHQTPGEAEGRVGGRGAGGGQLPTLRRVQCPDPGLPTS